MLSQYVGAYIFLWSIKAPLKEATPLTIPRYVYYFHERKDLRERLELSSLAGLAAIAGAALVVLLPRRPSLHGDARFARRGEIARSGLFARHGIFLGRIFGRYLILPGQQGAIVSAPPRSDKGTAIVVPNCLFWRDSLLCLDIKLENWTLTSGYRRALGQECHLINPLDPSGNTSRQNPLYYVPEDPNLRITGIQRIGATLFPEIPGTDPFWASGARSLFLGLALYVLETPSLPPTLGEVFRQSMASDAEGFSAHWKRIISGRQSGRFPLSAQCVRSLSDIMDLAPVTASSIRKTFTSRLDLFANPLIDAATSHSDFDWRDLRRRPISVFLGIQPGDLDLLRPLLNLFVEQAIALQTTELPEHNRELKYQVLMLLDEATAPGAIPILKRSISYLPGYNVRLLLVIQAYSQLRDVYGTLGADTMMKSLAARVLYAPKDFSEANEISQELGQTTVKVKSLSKPLFDGSSKTRTRSVSINEQRRPLLLPQEVKELGRDREILIYEGLRPVLARKNRYFQDPFFRKRLLPAVKEACPPNLIARRSPMPVVATPVAPAEPPAAEGSFAAEPPPKRRNRVREATIEDIERIDSLALGDFDVDFSKVQIPDKPPGERLTKEELNTAVESFLATLREA